MPPVRTLNGYGRRNVQRSGDEVNTGREIHHLARWCRVQGRLDGRGVVRGAVPGRPDALTLSSRGPRPGRAGGGDVAGLVDAERAVIPGCRTRTPCTRARPEAVARDEGLQVRGQDLPAAAPGPVSTCSARPCQAPVDPASTVTRDWVAVVVAATHTASVNGTGTGRRRAGTRRRPRTRPRPPPRWRSPAGGWWHVDVVVDRQERRGAPGAVARQQRQHGVRAAEHDHVARPFSAWRLSTATGRPLIRVSVSATGRSLSGCCSAILRAVSIFPPGRGFSACSTSPTASSTQSSASSMIPFPLTLTSPHPR